MSSTGHSSGLHCVSVVLSGVWPSATPWTVAHPTPLFRGLPRQENWRRLPFPSPGNLQDPRSEPVYLTSTLAGGFFCVCVFFLTTARPGKPDLYHQHPSHCVPWPGFLCSHPEMFFWVSIFLHNVCPKQCRVKLNTVCGGGSVFKSCPTLATTWTVACQDPLYIAISRQEHTVGCHSLLQGIFPTQGSNLGLLHCRQIHYWQSPQGKPQNSLLSSNLCFPVKQWQVTPKWECSCTNSPLATLFSLSDLYFQFSVMQFHWAHSYSIRQRISQPLSDWLWDVSNLSTTEMIRSNVCIFVYHLLKKFFSSQFYYFEAGSKIQNWLRFYHLQGMFHEFVEK